MAEHIVKMPPKERKIIDGPFVSELDREKCLTITAVDRKQHTVSLNIGGFPVTLICSPENNPKPYQQVKAILLDMVAGAVPQNSQN